MALDSQKIRHEVRRILGHGRTRSTKLATAVLKKTGSEKTVYREIKAMTESGEIRKIEHSRADVEYELVSITEAVDNHLKVLLEQLNEINAHITNFHIRLEKVYYGSQLMFVVTTIRQIQKIQTRLHLLSNFPAFKTSAIFSEVDYKINDVWQSINGIIGHQTENDNKFLNEVMINFSHTRIIDAKVKE